MLYFLIFIIGLIFGSFFMVVGLRFPNNESIVKPRSHCPKCQKPLKWYELIPVISYILSLGKCYNCHEKISITYPVIELLTGTLFALGFYLFGLSYEFYAFIILSSVLVIIYVSDFNFLIILDSPTIIASIIIFILKFVFFGYKAAFLALASAVLVFSFLYGVRNLGNISFKKEAMGGGDVKLALLIGMTLGVKLGITAILISCFLALPFSFIIMAIKKDKLIPFGPFLITATLITFIYMEQISNFLGILIYN